MSMCPAGDLLFRAHLDALDSFAPQSGSGHDAKPYAWSAWQEVLHHRAECRDCRPRLPRPDGALVL